MKRSSHVSPSGFYPPVLEIFSTQISDDNHQLITHALTHSYQGILDICRGKELELLSQAYHQQRQQYNANLLLRFLLTQKTKNMALWIISQDLYTQQKNFIFGLAHYY